MHSFIDLLHTKGVHVYLVSGGFRQVVCICTLCACAFMYVDRLLLSTKSYPFYGIQIQLITYTNTYICIYIHIQMINPVAEILNIPSHRIYANNLLFNVCMCFLVFIYEYPFVSYVFTYQWMDVYVCMYVCMYGSMNRYKNFILHISAKFILC